MSSPIIISIEGNIGSGKSTFVDKLQQYFKKDARIHFIQEPVDEWNKISDDNGVTILEKFYKDSDKYAFAFQMMAYISRLSILRKAISCNKYDIIITERSMFTDRFVFAQMLYDDKKIETVEYKIYLKWFDEFIEDLPPIFTFYLKTNPDVSNKRVLKRARQGETIPLSYLENCHTYHEKWLSGRERGTHLEIDGNADTTENPGLIIVWINEMEDFIKRLKM